MTSRRLGTAFALLVAALGIASCGDGSNEPDRGLPATAALVGPKNIAATETGSPNHAFMLWWRSMQYADVQSYNRRLSRALKARPGHARRARRQLAAVAGQVLNVYPHIKRVETQDGRATLYVELEVRTLVGAERYTSTRVPRAFPMVREAGSWKIDDDLYVESVAAPELRKLAAADARAAAASPRKRSTTSPALPAVPAAGADATSPRNRAPTTPTTTDASPAAP